MVAANSPPSIDRRWLAARASDLRKQPCRQQLEGIFLPPSGSVQLVFQNEALADRSQFTNPEL
jgi:hypothetical protein